MSLSALKDLFARHRTRATGLWRVGKDPHRTVFMEAGDIVFAASTHPQERLTRLLVERGRITQVQLDYECGTILAAGGRICVGDQLHPRGVLDPAVYRTVMVWSRRDRAPEATARLVPGKTD